MIFVTVGTHEQPFDRLIRYMDDLANKIDEDVIIQTGYSTYEPKHCTWRKIYSYQQILEFVKEARIVITHGGPSSFILPIQMGKIPIVVPRQCKYGEHVNDHQMQFVHEAAERMGRIIVIENIDKLGESIKNYNIIAKEIHGKNAKNNEKFCIEFEKIINEMF